MSAATIDSRTTHLENSVSAVNVSVGALATQFADFLRDTKDNRARTEAEQARMWAAQEKLANEMRESQEKQSRSLQSAIDKLSSKGQITWPVIVSTVGLLIVILVTLFGYQEKLSNAHRETGEAKDRQVEITQAYDARISEMRDSYLSKEADQRIQTLRELNAFQKGAAPIKTADAP